ncbi:uncharacterized protein BDV14DRAFT_180311 [Aspergillus stella-maris]|uniref:uncharacterized protein n=1 Tax=Aspergillus stella-maris TaxID=1810926 RepID=UPI003CCE1651
MPSPIRGEDERLQRQGFDDLLRRPFRKEGLLRMLGFWARMRVVPRSGPDPGSVVGMATTGPGLANGGVRPLGSGIWGRSNFGVRGPRSLL